MKLEEIPEPIGSFILKQTDIKLSSFETSQLIFNKVISKFAEDKIQYKGLLGANENLAELYFSKAIELLSPLYPDNIVFSLTHSDSLYFRIYKGNKEITLEVFYSQYDAEDDIEAVVSIYKGEILEKKDFGKLEDVCKLLKRYEKKNTIRKEKLKNLHKNG